MRDLAQCVGRSLLAPISYSNTHVSLQYLRHLLHEHSFPSPCLIHFLNKKPVSFPLAPMAEQKPSANSVYWDPVRFSNSGNKMYSKTCTAFILHSLQHLLSKIIYFKVFVLFFSPFTDFKLYFCT